MLDLQPLHGGPRQRPEQAVDRAALVPQPAKRPLQFAHAFRAAGAVTGAKPQRADCSTAVRCGSRLALDVGRSEAANARAVVPSGDGLRTGLVRTRAGAVDTALSVRC